MKVKFGKDPRQYSTTTKQFLDDGNGNLTGVNTIEVEWTKSPTGQWQMKEVAGTEKHHPADLILLAMGFLGPEKNVPTQIGEFDLMRSLKFVLIVVSIRLAVGQPRKHSDADRDVRNIEPEGVRRWRLPSRTVAGRLGHQRGTTSRPTGRFLPHRKGQRAARTRRRHRSQPTVLNFCSRLFSDFKIIKKFFPDFDDFFEKSWRCFGCA